MKGKSWGTTTVLKSTPQFELHRLDILPGHHCSWHHHERKWNDFVCLSGVLYIAVRSSDVPAGTVVRLLPGQVTSVPPGEMHRFYTTEVGAEALEMYYPDVLSEDIVRADMGGSNA